MRDSWDRRVDRAAQLAARDEAARPLLETYGRLLRGQRDAFNALGLNAARLTGSLEADLPLVRRAAAPVLAAAIEAGPPSLAEDARRIQKEAEHAVDALLLVSWLAGESPGFFAKAILQPYAEHLAMAGVRPDDRPGHGSSQSCPFCGGAPQLSVLRSSGNSEGGGRFLQCATCLTEWPVRRVLCPHCGEEDERRLGYYHAPAFDHLRVDACETCRRYLKSVDLTRLGLAVPLVDEVAGASLDLWAVEQGYAKIEINLVGL